MDTSSIRRQVKNIVHNYSEAEVKVREATSNDPWGPSTSLMSEISQMTYNTELFNEVMMMIWRRLNDSGKNWRHVYKSLTLLDYLLKNGSNKVVQEFNENLISVQTLKDFQFLDRDGKDQGINVREKAKQLVALIKDEEKLKEERILAQNTRRRMSSKGPSAISNQMSISTSQVSPSKLSSDLEQVRPQSTGEEELQLQLALAMSKEEAEKKTLPSAPEEDEELQLQMALQRSKEEYEKDMRSCQGEISLIEKALMQDDPAVKQEEQNTRTKNESHLSDLVDLFGPTETSTHSSYNIWGLPDTVSVPPVRSASYGSLSPPWGTVNHYDNISTSLPWASTPHITQLKEDNMSQSIIFSSETSTAWKEPPPKDNFSDPWGNGETIGVPTTLATKEEPWSAKFDLLDSSVDIFGQPPLIAPKDPSASSTSPLELDFQDDFTQSKKQTLDALDLTGLEEALPDSSAKLRSRTPDLFLEPAARTLVNLDSLFSTPGSIKSKNPFNAGLSAPSPNNPFQLGDQKPSLNQLRATSPAPVTTGAPITSLRTISPVPPFSMPGLNSLQAFPQAQGFAMPPGLSLPLPLQSVSPVMGFQPTMNSSFNQIPIVNQLSQPFVPLTNPLQQSDVSSQAVTNPFL
ncbi:epsin-3 [Bombina bombina]|uniref:epsin-3 n=1 Tax=Bombina bombina TaxID=8345 RepID=UPI00235AE9FF|nr:epsin-3 [Bombina bombina]XP_053564765.1 epsin-3 [Bombina bombina]XP_053564774.1 epsin-3 [Bombina bombina]